MTLRYPTESGAGDWVTFQAHDYRSNAAASSGGEGPASGQAIVLYMPNSTPTIRNGQTWEAKKFEGPMGVAAREIGGAVASGAVKGLDRTTGGYGVIDGLAAAAGQIKNLPDIARQGAIQAAGEFAGVTANQIMAFSSGKVFNPNIELLYEGPNVRSFDFNFSFIPKSDAEARVVAEIIREFKRLSAPSTEGSGMMYKIPKIWKINYNGVGGSWMNKFKKAAMTAITVQYNAGLSQHATFSSGFPIRTDIQMAFTEVDVITSEDHASGAMGF